MAERASTYTFSLYPSQVERFRRAARKVGLSASEAMRNLIDNMDQEDLKPKESK